MRVLMTGSEGYIGAVMRDVLADAGHEVVGLDTGYFEGCDFGDPPTPIPLIKRDLREVEATDFEGFDAVAHLAALSNDPLGNLAPGVTEAINTNGSIRVAEKAKEAGVPRFLFASSCSLYGQGAALGLTEEAEPNPQTPYAHSKIDFERALQAMADDNFSPVYLRNATAYGVSPRLRFDIVVNNLCGWAWTTGKIQMSSDGTPWRPLVHIRDISRAFLCALEAPKDVIHNQAFNVGSSKNNVQIRDIAFKVQKQMPECEVTFGNSDGDNRTYNVDFTKIETKLPGFGEAQISVDDAITEFLDAFKRLSTKEEDFQSRLYTRLKQINHLRSEGRLSDDLVWL
ncbi:MAG: NAD-dependent epimerase/dehydratase family protein [Candidatus Hydrogenedens sp.]|nr:NAD-dependent epimerase/dehydratase family protein [Candidatus Hydrogenedens sp.]